MILIDTSAWIEFFRDTGSATCEEVDRVLARQCATTDPVLMEVFSGARDASHYLLLQSILARSSLLRCESGDYLAASELYRDCRTQGLTIRKMIDCLIAAVAIRRDAILLHRDSDFDALAQCSALKVHAH